MWLFLDYDGCLHDSEVYLAGRQPRLRGEGKLFQHAALLVEALDPRPDVQIILSTSWVAHLGYDRAKSYLPPELQRLVVGATYHRHAVPSKAAWLRLCRFYQVITYVSRHRLVDWLAIDDDADGWPEAFHKHLVHCHDEKLGIGHPEVLKRLREALKC